VQKRTDLSAQGTLRQSMACPRCGTDCNCACSGDPLPSQDWRRQVSLQVRAHKVRKRRRLDPDAPLLEFEEQDSPAIGETSPVASRVSKWRWDERQSEMGNAPLPDPEAAELETIASLNHDTSVAVEESSMALEVGRVEPPSLAGAIVNRPPLPPFPRISSPVPKIIEFPRMQARQYELAEPVADQLRIFEALEDVLPPPPPSHLSEIQIAPEEPAHVATDLEVPIQTAPLQLRAYAAALDAIVMMGATGLFAICAKVFVSSLPMTKPLLASAAVCLFLLLAIYYLLSLSFCRATPGMEVSGLRVISFSGEIPSRTLLHWRALATVLSCAALGMGFAWSLIDEDRLCWHDRITHTYLTSK